MRQLRDYQLANHKAITDARNNGVINQLNVMPTGTGKTFTMCDYISAYFDSTLWLTHREELIDQSGLTLAQTMAPEYAEEISEFVDACGGIVEALNKLDRNVAGSDALRWMRNNIGVIKQGRNDHHRPIVIASVQTLWRRLAQIHPDSFECIVIDEAHYCMAKTWRKSVEHFNVKLRIGLTATPHRADGVSLSNLFDEIVFEYDLPTAIHEGYLVEIDAVQVKTNINLDNVHTRGGEFISGELQHVVDCPERNNLIVDKYLEYAEGRQAIFYCVNIEHAKNLADTFFRRGVKSVNLVVSDKELCPDRKDIIKKFKRGEIDILCNVDILTTGFDYPELSVVGCACPTKSLTKYIQTVGRGTRPIANAIKGLETSKERREAIKASNKPHLTLLDFVDVTSRHKLVNTWELDRRKPFEEKIFMTEQKREEAIEQREKMKREARIDRHSNVDKRIELIPMPEIKFPRSIRWEEPATEKQIRVLLAKNLITLEELRENDYTKEDASRMIGSKEVSMSKVQWLRENNFDAPDVVTFAEYSAAKKMIQEKLKLKYQKQ